MIVDVDLGKNLGMLVDTWAAGAVGATSPEQHDRGVALRAALTCHGGRWRFCSSYPTAIAGLRAALDLLAGSTKPTLIDKLTQSAAAVVLRSIARAGS